VHNNVLQLWLFVRSQHISHDSVKWRHLVSPWHICSRHDGRSPGCLSPWLDTQTAKVGLASWRH